MAPLAPRSAEKLAAYAAPLGWKIRRPRLAESLRNNSNVAGSNRERAAASMGEAGARARSSSLCLAVLHLSAPGAGLLTAALDQLLEPLEVATHL